MQGDGLEAGAVSIWDDTGWMKVTVQTQRTRDTKTALRARTRLSFMFDAPEDCDLSPFDCVMLEQSIRRHGNEPPRWIVAASRYWLRSRGLTPMHLRPAVRE